MERDCHDWDELQAALDRADAGPNLDKQHKRAREAMELVMDEMLKKLNKEEANGKL